MDRLDSFNRGLAISFKTDDGVILANSFNQTFGYPVVAISFKHLQVSVDYLKLDRRAATI